MSELRFAVRRLRSEPSFAAAAVLLLALGIGGATSVFTLVHGIVLEPLAFPQPGRLVRLTHTVADAGRGSAMDQSDATLMLYETRTRAFDGVAGWRFDDGDLGAAEPGQEPVRVRGARVTAGFFDVLGVGPALGRTFEPGEDMPGAPRVVVLSHRVWQDRFHGSPGAIGRQVVVNDVPRTIVGIMPRSFAYPTSQVELWLPLALDPARTHPATFNLVGIGRLAPGVSPQTARADLERVLPSIRDVAGDALAPAAWEQLHVAPRVQLLRDSIVGPVSRLLWLLFGSVVLVLLVACTNVAALFLLRAERMQGELAVRGALGSGLGGMVALLSSEAILLTALGGGAGVLLAAVAMRWTRTAGGALSLPRLDEVALGPPAALFAVGTTAVCALAVGVLPLLRARRLSIAEVLRGPGARQTVGPSRQRARDGLVTAQIALAFVLVASSGLMTRSFLLLTDVPPGFQPDRLVTSRVLLPYARYGGASSRLAFFESLKQRVQALPGAREVAITDRIPLSHDRRDLGIEVEGGASSAPSGGATHAAASVDGAYFETLRIPLLRGRTFGAQDPLRPSDEAIVSHAFAQRYWPGASPLGQRIRPLDGPWHTVVGEVGDVHYDALDQPANEIAYFPIVLGDGRGGVGLSGALSVVVRVEGGEREMLTAIRGIVHALDPAVPTYDEGSLDELVRDASSRYRALAVLLAVASAVTSLLAAIGLYGIMAYRVSSRRRELAVRIALGARPVQMTRMVSVDGLRLAGIGIAVGLASALALSRLLRGLLYGVAPTDLLTLGLTPVALLIVALGASWLPARRAAAIQPAEALRGP